jgi:hypothetical protein
MSEPIHIDLDRELKAVDPILHSAIRQLVNKYQSKPTEMIIGLYAANAQKELPRFDKSPIPHVCEELLQIALSIIMTARNVEIKSATFIQRDQ